ncbi:MAG: hypothetical protein II818_03710, partial [Aeriscardovia sp.]|nr:hypothetical protein [Aeriscardovia sp.]
SFVIKRGLTNLAVSQPPAFACQRADARSTLLSSQPANCAEASSASDLIDDKQRGGGATNVGVSETL